MKMIKAYSADGECLGDEFVDFSELQKDTKLAIYQIIYLDESVAIINDHIKGE